MAMSERKIPQQRMPSPEELETKNKEIIARRKIIIDYTLSVPDEQVCPSDWSDNDTRKLFSIKFDPKWRDIEVPWRPDEHISAAAVVLADKYTDRWFGVFEKKPNGYIWHLGSIHALDKTPILLVGLDPNLGQFQDARWGGENAKKFLDISEELLKLPDEPEKS